MFYAVNRKTREHRVVTWQDNDFVDMGWDLVDADADGWIRHDGGECPLPLDQPVECKDKHGAVMKFSSAGSVIGWIKAVKQYRPILEPQADQAKEWRGPEDGLPPVGRECEFEHAEEGNWVNAKVIGHDGPACVVALDGFGYSGSDNPRDFRPIRTDRERWTDAAMEAAECHDSAPLIRQYFEAIYDAGLARLPEE